MRFRRRFEKVISQKFFYFFFFFWGRKKGTAGNKKHPQARKESKAPRPAPRLPRFMNESTLCLGTANFLDARGQGGGEILEL